MNAAVPPPGTNGLVKPFKFPTTPHEFRITALRECPTPEQMQLCETADHAAHYWHLHVSTHSHFDPERESLVVLLLNTRRRIKGHQLVSIGGQDMILVHAREVFRLAITTAAHAIALMHNHPSGDSSPSDADIRVTRDMIKAGQLLKIEVVDHVIVGAGGHFSSLRALGYFS